MTSNSEFSKCHKYRKEFLNEVISLYEKKSQNQGNLEKLKLELKKDLGFLK